MAPATGHQPKYHLYYTLQYEYWDNPAKFHQVIGLLHQLKLDTSTQVLEYQQVGLVSYIAKFLM